WYFRPIPIKLPKTPPIIRTTTAQNPLTLGARNVIKLARVVPSIHSAERYGVQHTVVNSEACLNAEVAFLVMELAEVLNVRQASQYLGICPDTLYRYITEGEIPAFKLGNRWKLRKTILDRWMERKMNQSTGRRR